MNESEKLFEKILTKPGITFSKIPASEIRTPDYKVFIGSLETFWEIKEVKENESEKDIVKSVESGQVKVYSVNSDRVEASIKSAAGQFKSYKVTDRACIVALTDLRDFSVKDLFFTQVVQSKMIGSGHYMQDGNGQYFECFREAGLFTNRKNYISAIAIMFKATEDIVFLHNPNANISILSEPLMEAFEHHYFVIKGQYGLEWKKL